MAYIYQITNDINNKIYIGKTELSIDKRFHKHCEDAFRDRNKKRPLYDAMQKYGIEHFHVELIEETDNPEEREIYWIEQKQSFRNGYNATRGGDGRKYIDYDLVIATYNELQCVKDTADKLNISIDSVELILKQNNIKIISSQELNRLRYGKIVNMYDLDNNYLRSFSSLAEAGQYLIDNNLTNCKCSTIRCHISEVCRGKRKTAAKFRWKYAE